MEVISLIVTLAWCGMEVISLIVTLALRGMGGSLATFRGEMAGLNAIQEREDK